jgi:uroporphyrinogen-III decarboxylase
LKPKERILKAISGEVPDRVPSIPKIWVDLAANLMGILLLRVIQDPYLALKVIADAAISINADGARQFHFPVRKVIVEKEKVIEIDEHGKHLGEIDMMGGLVTQLYHNNSIDLTNPYHVAHQHFWKTPEPLIKNMEDVKSLAVPDKKFYHETGCAKRQEKILKNTGDKLLLVGDCNSATLAFYVDLCGYEKSLFDLVDNPSLVHATMEKGAAIAIERGKFNIDIGLNVLRLNDSVANMSVISPKFWREFIFPHMKEVCSELHSYCHEAKIYCHICGNILPVVHDLVKTGLDCIGPMDPIGNFTPAQVREIVGDDVSLLGGVNTLSFILKNPEEILDEARQCMYEAGKYGGYILSSGCVIPRATKKVNLIALYQAVEKYGYYQNGNLV